MKKKPNKKQPSTKKAQKKKAREKEVRAAIVGMGIGRPNGRAIAANERGRVVALCDLKQDRMDQFAKELPEKPKTYTDYKKMCADPKIDAVFVGTPNQLHVPVAMEAVKNDKHVLITKPLADASEPARELVDAAENAGVVNMMSLSTRFGPDCRYVGQLAEDGFFGDIYYARARSIRRSGIPAWNMGFVTEGGGAFRDMGVHVLDAVWWIMGMPNPESVMATAGAKFGPYGRGYWNFQVPSKQVYTQYAADDYAAGLVRFADGSAVQVESFWASHQAPELQIELFGTEAGGKLRPVTLYQTVNNAPHDVTVDIPDTRMGSWEAIADHFIECILDDVECTAPLRHGLIVQQMMEAVLESGEKGKEVAVD